MDSQKLQEQLIAIENSNALIEQSIQLMKQTIAQLIDENSHLKIENIHLREKLDALESVQTNIEHIHIQTVGISNLDKLYHSGVHICHNFYGAKRDEMCLLCESLLSQNEES